MASSHSLVYYQLEGMKAIAEILQKSLPSDPESSKQMLEINTREALFKYVNNSTSLIRGRYTYSIRVDGILKSLDGFVRVIQEVDNKADDEFPKWKAMLWGSSALGLAQLYGRQSGHEQILTFLEDLTTASGLPSPTGQSAANKTPYMKTVLVQLFAELASGLLNIATSLQKYPQAPQQKHSKFSAFEGQHIKTVERVHLWSEKFHNVHSSATQTPSEPVGPVQQPSSRMPVHINQNFHGREDYLSEIRNGLQNAEEYPSVVCIHGLPGVGKTQLAAQYCNLYGPKYFATIWVEADTPTKILGVFSKYALQLRLDRTSPDGEPLKNAQLLVSWLQTTDQLWIVVFDNVDDVQDLKDYWPSGGNGHIVVSSRSPYTAEFRSSQNLHLLPLTPVQSKELFYKIIGESREAQHSREVDEVLAEWEGVPLALNHIGSYIRRLHLDLNRFVKMYNKSSAKILQEKHSNDDYPHSIATAFSVNQLDRGSKALLQGFSYFDPDEIPNELILSSFDEDQNFQSIDSEFDYYEGLKNLCKVGLIYQDDSSISIHRLVQSVVLTGMEEKDHQNTFDEVLRLLNQNFPREVEGKSLWADWKLCDKYLPHVLYLCKRYEVNFTKGRHSSSLASLLAACTWYMFERGLFAEAEPLIQIARTACSETSDSTTLATVLFNLAGLRFECNRIKEALELCVQILEIRRRMLDSFDPLLGNTYYSIGIVYMEDNQLEKSLESQSKAVEIHEAGQTKRNDGSPLAFAYMNMGLCYWKMKEWDLAADFAQKSLDLFLQASGNTSQKFGQGLFALGIIREAQNRFEEARELHQISLDICLGNTPNHFKSGLGLHKIATFLHREGKFEEAIVHLQRAIAILETSFDPIPRVARSMFKLSQVLEDAGRMDEAAAKRMEAERLRALVTTFTYDRSVTMEAYDTLIPSFLC